MRFRWVMVVIVGALAALAVEACGNNGAGAKGGADASAGAAGQASGGAAGASGGTGGAAGASGGTGGAAGARGGTGGGGDAGVPSFVIRNGNALTVDGVPFRVVGTNVYWLGLDADNGGSVGGVHYPTHFAVDDALDTALAMGANVVRSHTLGISTGCTHCLEPKLGTFNDAAFASIDYAIHAARQRGIRLIIPLTDGNTPCFYHGCRRDFVDWVHPGSTNDNLFFTDSAVIAAFEAYVSHLLKHVNAYTGVAYRNDPTIMAWESGNELDDGTAKTTTWLSTISAYVKSIDPHHLFMDGGWTMNAARLAITTVDLYTRHHYNGWFYPGGNGTAISDDNYYGCQADAAGKVYIVGEYDWTGAHGAPLDLSTYLPNVENHTCSSGDHAVNGDLYWSLFPHKDTDGFEQHGDGFTLHWAGDTSSMRQSAQALRKHAFAMRGLPVPAAPTPAAPLVYSPSPVSGGVRIDWRGVANAVYYQVERTTNGGASWKVVSPGTSPSDGTVGGLTDNDTPWTDASGTSGPQYRVRAFNLDNVPGPYGP